MPYGDYPACPSPVPPPTFEGRGPFAGHKLFIWNSPTHRVIVDGPVECLAESGCHIFVRNSEGKEAWINLNVIPSIEIRDGEAVDPESD